MSALTKLLPRKSSRTSTHAISVPVTMLITATIAEMTTVSSSAARAEGALSASQNPLRPLSNAFVSTAASGSRTMMLNHSVATPSPRARRRRWSRPPSCPAGGERPRPWRYDVALS